MQASTSIKTTCIKEHTGELKYTAVRDRVKHYQQVVRSSYLRPAVPAKVKMYLVKEPRHSWKTHSANINNEISIMESELKGIKQGLGELSSHFEHGAGSYVIQDDALVSEDLSAQLLEASEVAQQEDEVKTTDQPRDSAVSAGQNEESEASTSRHVDGITTEDDEVLEYESLQSSVEPALPMQAIELLSAENKEESGYDLWQDQSLSLCDGLASESFRQLDMKAQDLPSHSAAMVTSNEAMVLKFDADVVDEDDEPVVQSDVESVECPITTADVLAALMMPILARVLFSILL